jgi:hypothetical protein
MLWHAAAFVRAWSELAYPRDRIADRSTEQFSSLLGLNGDNATQSVEESAASVQALIDSSTVVTSGVQNISGEWMRFVQNRVGNNLKSFEEMMSCQTVHDCLAIQTRMVRDNWEAFLHTARRASELSTKLADDAVKQMGEAAFSPR